MISVLSGSFLILELSPKVDEKKTCFFSRRSKVESSKVRFGPERTDIILLLGSIFYMDSWVAHVTFREHNDQINIVLIVKRLSIVCTTSALVFLPILSDFKCTLHFHSKGGTAPQASFWTVFAFFSKTTTHW